LYALQKISKSGHPKCVYCGCDFLRALDIHHKNENRPKLEKLFKKPERGYSFYKRIMDGDRPTGDLEIACKVCNWVHHYQAKFGLKWQIIYEGSKSTKA
jgi:hypothetical protein